MQAQEPVPKFMFGFGHCTTFQKSSLTSTRTSELILGVAASVAAICFDLLGMHCNLGLVLAEECCEKQKYAA